MNECSTFSYSSVVDSPAWKICTCVTYQLYGTLDSCNPSSMSWHPFLLLRRTTTILNGHYVLLILNYHQ